MLNTIISKKNINLIVGPVLFLILSYFLYQQIIKQPNLYETISSIKNNFSIKQWLVLLLVCLLMLINLGLEAIKFKLFISNIQSINFTKSFKSVFIGQAFAIGSVNNIGENAGKALLLNKGNRIKGVALSAGAGLSQLLITYIMGTIAFLLSDSKLLNNIKVSHFFLKEFAFAFMAFLLILSCIGFYFTYYKVNGISNYIQKIKWLHKLRPVLAVLNNVPVKQLNWVLGLSFFRYLVFTFQYIILLNLFKVNANTADLVLMVWLLFLVLAVVPSIAIAELGIRGQLSLLLIGLLSSNAAGIVFTATLIWFINRVVPAIIGSLLVINFKMYNKENSIDDFKK